MATGAQTHIDTTTAASFIPEIWSRDAIVARESALVMAEHVNRRYESELTFGDTIHVPSISNLTVQTKSTTAHAATIFETVTEGTTDITIGTWQYSAIALETATGKQTNRSLLESYAPKQGYALSQAIDDVLAGLIDDFSQTVGTLTVETSFDDFVRGDQYLNDADAPTSDRFILVSPAAKGGMMKLDQFVSGDYTKLNDGINVGAKGAALGTWLGTYSVFMSTNAEGTNTAGHDNGMWQRESLALVLQMKVTSHEMFDINYLAQKVVLEQLHGSAEMRDDHGVWVAGA
jgi:hypothetical protein